MKMKGIAGDLPRNVLMHLEIKELHTVAIHHLSLQNMRRRQDSNLRGQSPTDF